MYVITILLQFNGNKSEQCQRLVFSVTEGQAVENRMGRSSMKALNQSVFFLISVPIESPAG